MKPKTDRNGLWTADFLTAIRNGDTPTKAAAWLGLSRSTAYARRDKDAAFALAWDAAKCADTAAGGHQQTRKPGGPWKRQFLEFLAETSNVSASALRAKVKLHRAYQTRRSDPEFAALWRKALFEGYEHLEMEVLAYLRGNLPDRKIDVPNAIRQLAAHRKTVAEIRAFEDDENEQDVLDSIDKVIDEMKAEWAASEQAKNQNG
ncbi:hypothetical protein [Altererythrobacter aquiaggeris]|uniref:hypothetical protein n=1 Tax=Aestuarierythrobacter aquiaggeris TaxID=1898396 RepID=UPI0030193502